MWAGPIGCSGRLAPYCLRSAASGAGSSRSCRCPTDEVFTALSDTMGISSCSARYIALLARTRPNAASKARRRSSRQCPGAVTYGLAGVVSELLDNYGPFFTPPRSSSPPWLRPRPSPAADPAAMGWQETCAASGSMSEITLKACCGSPEQRAPARARKFCFRGSAGPTSAQHHALVLDAVLASHRVKPAPDGAAA